MLDPANHQNRYVAWGSLALDGPTAAERNQQKTANDRYGNRNVVDLAITLLHRNKRCIGVTRERDNHSTNLHGFVVPLIS